MAGYKPGRLKRTLDRVIGVGFPVFQFVIGGTLGFLEPEIYEVTIHRGKSGRGGGLSPSTLEIKVKGQQSATLTGTDCRFFIREIAAQRMAAHLDGSTTGDDFAMRAVGRIGQMSVEDDGKRFRTQLAAASWSARMLRRESRVVAPVPGATPASVILDAVGMTANPIPAGVNFTEHGPFDAVAAGPHDSINFRDAVNKFGSDIGVCIFEQRDGTTKVVSLPYREEQARLKAVSDLPLIRSQGIAPAEWEQVNDAPAITLQYRIRDANGNIATRTVDIQDWDPAHETVVHDWTYMQSSSSGTAGHSYREAYAQVFETSTRSFTVPSVKVDMIHLIGSDKRYHREVAAQILRMQVGDPLFFSGDWPAPLRGVHFAEGITESLNSESWEVEFSLVPWNQAVGPFAPPAILPRAWESALNTWDEETRKWDEV